MKRGMRIDPIDNVAVALEEVFTGEQIQVEDQCVTVSDHIPFAHKVAIRPISKNEAILKYGETMGHATKDILVGEHVHVHNVN